MKKKTSLKISLIIAMVVIILLVGVMLFSCKDNFIKNESTKYKENNRNKYVKSTTSKKIKSGQAKESIQDKTKEQSASATKESKTSKKDSKKTTKKKASKKKDEKDEKCGSKKAEKTNSTTSKTTSEAKPNVTVTTTKSKDQINNELRNNIKAKYGVSVSYKDEVDSNYSSSYAKPTKLYDDTEIYNHLLKIDSALSKYPKAFFPEIKNKWKQVTIDLVKNINGVAAGLTDNRNPNTVVILINTGGLLFESTLHHEMMHYIDCFLANKMGAYALESSMMEFNPEGFNYGNQNNDYVYRYANPYYFLSAYAKSNYKEDRAVIFEDLMSRTWKREYHTKGNPINEKAKVISSQISAHLSSVSDNVTEYWERFIEW